MENLGWLLKAKTYCEAGKHRFTKPRERVLSILINASKPMGAYQILEALSSVKEKVNPPTVYRAIEFWEQHGFIHRIQSMNAYLACCGHHDDESFFIFICDDCSDVVELKIDLPASISADIGKQHFTVTRSNTEVHGLCSRCKS